MDHFTSFASAKTSAPVPYASGIARLALIRATLDPAVVAIHPAPSRDATADCVATVRDGRGVAYALRVRDAERDPVPGGSVDRTTYARAGLEAMASSLESVWACRRSPVAAGDTVRILHVLDEHGSLPLVEVARAATAAIDGVAAVLALACRGAVVLDLDGPLGPETRVRRRRAAT